MPEQMPHELSMMTPIGQVTLATEPITDYLMGLQQLSHTLPHIDKADADAKEWIGGEIMETKVQEVSEKEFPVTMECFWRYIRQEYQICDVVNYGHGNSSISPIYHDFNLKGTVYKVPLKLIAHLKHKATKSRIALQFLPYDGLNIDLRIMFDHKCNIGKNLWQNFMDFFYDNCLLKGEKFYSNYKFINEAEENGWDDVVISDTHRKLLQRNVVDFLNNMDVFKGHGLKLSRGVLITGPPGTGKTLTCNVLMNDVNVTTMVVTRETLEDVGDIGECYKLAQKLAPTLLIFEDLDTLGGVSRYDGDHPLLGEFLNALSGVETNAGVVTLATTNHADKLDWALTDRPGRFDARMELGYPDEKLRGRIFEKYLKVIPHNGLLDMKSIVGRTQGLSGAYLEEIVRNAFVIALEDAGYNAKKTNVKQKHLDAATKSMLEHRNKAKKDMAKRDLVIDDDNDVEAFANDASFG